MERGILAGALAVATTLSMTLPAAATASAAVQTRVGPTTVANSSVLAAPNAVAVPTKSKKKVRTVTLKSGRKSVHVGGSVKLTGRVKPKRKTHVAFQQKFPGTNKWRGLGAKVTKKSGETTLKAGLTVKGTYKLRLATRSKKSKVIQVTATRPVPPVPPTPPDPPNPPKRIDVDWPSADPLEVDHSYDVPVRIKPEGNFQVRLQHKTDSGWDELYGGVANTGNDGSTKLILSVPDIGTERLRVDVVDTSLDSDVVSKDFTDGGDTLYNVPIKLPSKQGVLVKAEEFPMTYPKVPIPNPLDPGTNLILPQIGNPAAGPPQCVTDPAFSRSDCKIPGKQYRFMYTTERWYPDTSGGGSVQGGSQGATAIVMVPPNVKDDAPVVAWAHPTLGQANQCSVTRGTQDVMVPGNPNPQPGGMDINLIDMVFFLDQMLQAGYIVVMPDYLGIAVNGPTSNQKTYVVGPQEARDVYFAVDALQTGAKQDKGWPGLPQAGNDFMVLGHSQGGHAAMWTGIKSDDLGQETKQNLKGVVAVAPATDLNKMVDVQWNQQANWVIGPEVIQTWLGYLGAWALNNNTISDAAIANLGKYEDYCTTQAFAASSEFFPNGAGKPGVPFMKNPNDPANEQAFYNWSKIFSKMTPIIEKGESNSFPKDVPIEMISGTADQIVLSQTNAAMQESFCAGNANMSAYWTPVVTGAANPNPPKTDAFQAADHLNVLAFPWTNQVGKNYQLAGGAILQFAADRFAGKPVPSNCADRQSTHKNLAGVNTWYVFPAGIDMSKAAFYEAGGVASLPAPARPTMTDGSQMLNPPPATGSIKFVSKIPVNDTGCGTQGIGILQTKANPACTQWGLYPYGELIYKDGSVSGKTWGSYPYSPPKP